MNNKIKVEVPENRRKAFFKMAESLNYSWVDDSMRKKAQDSNYHFFNPRNSEGNKFVLGYSMSRSSFEESPEWELALFIPDTKIARRIYNRIYAEVDGYLLVGNK